MATSKQSGTSNNKYFWPKYWKFEIGDLLFISLCVSLYTVQRKQLFFKGLMCVGNDGNDWGIDRGG